MTIVFRGNLFRGRKENQSEASEEIQHISVTTFHNLIILVDHIEWK